VVAVVGRIMLLYRRRAEKPKIQLPMEKKAAGKKDATPE
jgi:hypothetical protein